LSRTNKTAPGEIKERFYNNESVREIIGDTEKGAAEGKMSPFSAARELLRIYFGK